MGGFVWIFLVFLRTAEIQKNLFRTAGLKITSGNWETCIHGDSETDSRVEFITYGSLVVLIHAFP